MLEKVQLTPKATISEILDFCEMSRQLKCFTLKQDDVALNNEVETMHVKKGNFIKKVK